MKIKKAYDQDIKEMIQNWSDKLHNACRNMGILWTRLFLFSIPVPVGNKLRESPSILFENKIPVKKTTFLLGKQLPHPMTRQIYSN